MDTVNVHEAKTHFSRLLERIAQGEEIIIAKSGKPMARLVPYFERHSPRHGSQWKGLVRIRDDFDEPLPSEISAGFSGKTP
ncbi:type II toxin-antitoxin system Phd/YefM family antitoxin [bacterium AH-315-J04]|nr:type II toxin-antitoxin system Phd/YefM family antitoxin [bacterium AH-315-J04]